MTYVSPKISFKALAAFLKNFAPEKPLIFPEIARWGSKERKPSKFFSLRIYLAFSISSSLDSTTFFPFIPLNSRCFIPTDSITSS